MLKGQDSEQHNPNIINKRDSSPKKRRKLRIGKNLQDMMNLKEPMKKNPGKLTTFLANKLRLMEENKKRANIGRGLRKMKENNQKVK